MSLVSAQTQLKMTLSLTRNSMKLVRTTVRSGILKAKAGTCLINQHTGHF